MVYCTEGQTRSTWNLGLGEDRQRLVRVRRLRCGADDEAVQVTELVEVRGGVGARRAGVPGAANGGQPLDRGRREPKVSKRPVEERNVRGTYSMTPSCTITMNRPRLTCMHNSSAPVVDAAGAEEHPRLVQQVDDETHVRQPRRNAGQHVPVVVRGILRL